MRNRHHLDLTQLGDVWFSSTAPFPRKIAKKACIKEGLRFEAQAQAHLTRKFPGVEHFPSKWISYTIGKTVCHAQPDHFFRADGKLYVLEMKLRHTPRSASQLVKYGHLLHRLFPNDRIVLVEVYKYWDWVHYPADHVKLHEDNLMAASDIGISLVHLDFGD